MPDLATLMPLPSVTPLLENQGVYLKPEFLQISGNIKYRLVHHRIREACAKNLIHPETILTEFTAGSTGIALATAGKYLGLRVEVHLYENCNQAKINSLEKLGVSFKFHSLKSTPGQVLQEIKASENSGTHWHLNQYSRNNLISAYQDLALEIHQQLGDLMAPEIFICPVGTGGIIQGVGIILKKKIPNLKIWSLEPEFGELIDGIRNTETHHMGKNDPFKVNFPDNKVLVKSSPIRETFLGYALGESASSTYKYLLENKIRKAVFIAAD